MKNVSCKKQIVSLEKKSHNFAMIKGKYLKITGRLNKD